MGNVMKISGTANKPPGGAYALTGNYQMNITKMEPCEEAPTCDPYATMWATDLGHLEDWYVLNNESALGKLFNIKDATVVNVGAIRYIDSKNTYVLDHCLIQHKGYEMNVVIFDAYLNEMTIEPGMLGHEQSSLVQSPRFIFQITPCPVQQRVGSSGW